MTDLNTALLPNGLMDLLPEEAEAEARAITDLMTVFSVFGYRRVKPPLVEFEDSLLSAGPGAAMTRQTFRLMDPVSQRMMGVRADTTAQIARIAGSRLAEEKRPLRLSYAAEVLRVNGTQLRPARQFTQVGCELMGAIPPQDDAEIMLLALHSLAAIGLRDLSIDITVPAVVGAVLDEINFDAKIRRDVAEILKRRDKSALSNISHPKGQILLGLMDASGAARDGMDKLSKIVLPPSAAQDVKALKDAVQSLEKGLAAYDLPVNITIDPIEHRGLDYETGVSFSIFSKQVRGELGAGGRYRPHVGREETATGFTLYMDTILSALPPIKDTNVKHVPADTSWDDVKKLQTQGFTVIRG